MCLHTPKTQYPAWSKTFILYRFSDITDHNQGTASFLHMHNAGLLKKRHSVEHSIAHTSLREQVSQNTIMTFLYKIQLKWMKHRTFSSSKQREMPIPAPPMTIIKAPKHPPSPALSVYVWTSLGVAFICPWSLIMLLRNHCVFLKSLFWSNLYTQSWAGTHKPQMENRALEWASQVPQINHFITSLCVNKDIKCQHPNLTLGWVETACLWVAKTI